MEVIEIVEIYLTDNGYDGLYNIFEGCACKIGDLAPCSGIDSDCSAGYKYKHSVTGDFVITPNKQPMNDTDIEMLISKEN